MLYLARLHSEDCQFCFKPHPLLYQRLCEHPDWGPNRTDDYWNSWAHGRNTFICETDYEQLFIWSDALIHDCNSFLAEYIVLNKPALFLIHDQMVNTRLNNAGQRFYRSHYQANSKNQIESFINNVVIHQIDPLISDRSVLIKSLLNKQSNSTASESIYRYILSSIYH